MKAEAKAKAYT